VDVAVYRFVWWDQNAGENVATPRFATLEAIARCDGEPIEDTRRLVDRDQLNGSGFLSTIALDSVAL
jgi:hypothetical protein